jgi:PleD family two-component response regulator
VVGNSRGIFCDECGDIEITLSIGAATDISVAQLIAMHAKLIKRADDRLYKAKHTGRNQIVTID